MTGKPAGSLTWSLLYPVLGSLVLGAIFCLIIGAGFVWFSVRCEDWGFKSHPSPDHIYMAQSFSRLCEGPFAANAFIEDRMVLSKIGTNQKVEIYEGHDGSIKAVRWNGNKELEIKLERERRLDGEYLQEIKIHYR
jgi:hypothetical protein